MDSSIDSSIMITDEDVYVTGASTVCGEMLKDVLDNHQRNIDQLKGNVKWIYKYGGVGSGTGGGGGSTGKMSVSATLNNSQIATGNVIQLNENTSSYELRIMVSGGGSYSATVTWGSNKSTTFSLTVDNNWTKVYTLTDITSNGNINIAVSDGSGSIITLYASYVVKPYTFDNLLLADKYGNMYPTQYININEAKVDKGVVVNCSYEISIEGSVQYYWIVPPILKGDASTGSETDPLSTDVRKSALKFQIDDNALIEENANDYSISLKYRVVPAQGEVTDWMSKTIDFFLIPSGLYLAITPEIQGSIYETPDSSFYSINLDSSISIGSEDYTVSESIITLTPNQVVYFDPSKQTTSVTGKSFTFIDYTKTYTLADPKQTIIYYRNSTTSNVNVRLCCSGINFLNGLKYEIVDESKIYSYGTNRNIVVYGRVFAGAVTGNSGTIYYKLDGTLKDPVIVTDTQKYNLPGIIFSNPGWHNIHFEYSFPYQGEQTSGTPVDRYVYVAEKSSDLNWFNNPAHILTKNYFRFDNVNTTFNDLKNNTTSINYDEKYVTDTSPRNIAVQNIPGSDISYDTMMNIGIQYSESNDDSVPLIRFQTYSVGTGYTDLITVYCNKLVYNSKEEINLYLHKETDYDSTNSLKYHLVTINYRYIRQTNGLLYRELAIYLDGILEGTLPTWNPALMTINRVVFNNVNMAVNLLEVDYPMISETRSQGKVSYTPSIVDNDVVYYYYTYKVKSNNDPSLVSDENMKIMDIFFDGTTKNVNYTIDASTSLLKIDKSTFETLTGTWADVSQRTGLPVLVASTPRHNIAHNIDVITQWMNPRYNEGSDSEGSDTDPRGFKIPVSLEWGSLGGGIADPFGNEKYIYDGKEYRLSEVTQFSLKLQGSSTLRYKSKNFTLNIDWASGFTEQDVTPVFSPNYDSANKKTFLPESSFTLKADMVDSAHTNNTAIGEFVNDNNVYANPYKSLSGENVDHVKDCLTGFPFIMIFKTTGQTDADTVYFILGVYNFNLGRSSYFNLGYCDNSLLNGLTTPTNNMFAFKAVSNMEILDTFVAAEVQGNAKYWDFSQYDESVLFTKYSQDGGYYMFDDIVYNKAKNINYATYIKRFVEGVSKAGGYIFNEIGKNFVPVGTDSSMLPYYHIKNTVPDNRYQYMRGTKDTYTLKTPVIESHGSEQDLINCIKSDDTTGTLVPEYLLYDSVLYYYMTCMAFGLVDSVQKNLNIKTWNNRTFGIYFYDMDTCLGIDNDGHFTSYFCFSDYWKTIVSNPEKRIIDGQEVDVYQIDINNCEIFRDYYPEDASASGFDIPSSYLYAISKYAQSIHNFGYTNTATIWAKWRSIASTGVVEGPLSTADKFVDTYYASHLAKVSPTMMNLNYRNKYMAEENDLHTGFNANTSTALHGKNIERTRDWLSNRLHVLDGYFNLFLSGDNSLVLHGNYNEPKPEGSDINYIGNSDVCVYRDIFNSTNEQAIKRTGTLSFVVKANDNSPLVILDGTVYKRFFLEDSDRYYGITYSYSGSTNSRMCGSPLWTYLDSINSFITTIPSTSQFYLSSKRLTNVSGTVGNLTSSMIIDAKNAKKIALNSPGYSASLSIDSTFNSLSEVDLSNSKISLNLSDPNGQDISIKTLKLRNLGGADSVVINNTPKLTGNSVDVYNATITNCTISRSWDSSTMDLSGTKITSLTIMANVPGTKFVMKNNDIIRSINVNGFSYIEIDNCPSLTQVNVISNPQLDPYVNSISITKCPVLTSCSIGCKFSSAFRKLDMNNCVALASLSMQGGSDSSYDGMTTLNLRSTLLSGITWMGTTYDSSLFDMRPLTSLTNGNMTSLNLSNMVNLEAILCTNNQNTPARIRTSFAGCDKFKRVYGCVVMTNGSAFSGCNKFSIHGDNLETLSWKGYSVLDSNGRVKMPYEVISDYEGGVASNGPKIYGSGEQASRMAKYFNPGTYVTNMYFDSPTFASMFNSTNVTLFDVYYFLSMIPNEAVTVGNCQINNICRNVSACFYMSSTYGNIKFGKFYWNPTSSSYIDPEGKYYLKANCDNSPNRYTFFYCPQLTSVSSMFYSGVPSSSYSHYYSHFKIYSPETTTTGGTRSISKDNGLFSYLSNVTNISSIFYLFSPYIDRFVFRRSDDKKYSFSSFDYFNVYMIVDDVNSLTVAPSSIIYQPTANIDNFGNLSGFFNDITGLTSFTYSFNGVDFINYDYQLKLPSTITSMYGSFNSNYAKGDLDFDDIFSENQQGKYNMTSLRSSFIVSKNINASNPSVPISKLYVTNDLFSKFTNLTTFGYYSDIDGTGSTPFSGAGIKKVIPSGTTTFPYDILNNIKDPSTGIKCDKLVTFAGFFTGVEFEEQSYTDVELPGDMFTGNTKLENISGLFWNAGFKYKLSDGERYRNFKDCKNLKRCDYLFGSTVEQTVPNLSGKIPYEFFYHGGNQVVVRGMTGFDASVYSETKVYHFDDVCTFANILYRYISLEDSSIGEFDPTKWRKIKENGDYLPSTVVISSQDSFSYEKPYKTIEDMRYCFSHCNVEYYENDISSETYSGDETKYIKRNPDYSKFDYIIDSSTLDASGNIVYKLHRNTGKNIYPLTYCWGYDGIYSHRPISVVSMCDELDPVVDDVNAGYSELSPLGASGLPSQPEGGMNTYHMNYAFPPDLLKYCTENVNASSLFYGSGSSGWSAVYSNGITLFTDTASYKSFGMTGRLCPYMFKPVEKMTNLSYMFNNCKRLSGYATTDSSGNLVKSYIIPQDLFLYLTATQEINLSYMFSGMVPPSLIDIDVIKKMKSKTANVTGMFYRTRWLGTQANPVTIARIFGNSYGNNDAINTTSTKYCFACSGTTEETFSDFPRTQFVTFDHVFRGYNMAAYTYNTDYSFTFNGYAQHDGFRHEISDGGVANATVPVNEELSNYRYFGQ